MRTLTGTGSLVRLILRRDRIRIAVWVIGLTFFALSSASGVQGLYQSRAELIAAARIVQNNPAFIAMNGPAQALGTFGGRAAWEIGAFGLSAVALMSMFLMGRQTRAEEESGRLELVRAAVIGRHAPVTAALIVVSGVNLLLGALVAAGFIALDFPTRGSIFMGATFFAVGLVFAALTAVTAQVTENTRGVYGITGALLGVAFVVRAAGDIGNGALSWLSPIGWAQAARPFAGERLWPLLLAVGVSGLLVYAAFALVARRDVGAGLVAQRPGPPVASQGLTRPLGLALRLQRGALIGWTAALFLSGLAYGSVGKDVEDLIADSPEMADMLAQAGGNLVDSFFATTMLMLALLGSGFSIQSALRLRSEESSGRAEPLLATCVSRARWTGSHLTVAIMGAVLVVGAGGLGTGLAYGLSIGDLGQVPRLLGASLVHIPAVWVLTGLAMALFGLSTRVAMIAWAALAASIVIGFFAQLFGFPDWVRDVSPFTHTPQVPAVDPTIGPLLVLGALATVLVALGGWAFRRRDVATT
jgi:ABC-2 type transport system permease protein